MDKKDIKSMTMEELTEDFLAMGEKKFRATQVYEWLHQKLVRDFSQSTGLPASSAAFMLA